MHLSFCEWKVGFYCVVKLEWSWFPFVYMQCCTLQLDLGHRPIQISIVLLLQPAPGQMSYHFCCFKTHNQDPCPIDFSQSRQEVLSGVRKMCNTVHGVIYWSQASGRGRFSPTKTVIAEKYHPSVLKFCLTWTVYNISNNMTKFHDDVYSFERVRGCQFLKLYISMFEKWLESPQWLPAVSKPKVRMRVTSAWGQE